MFNKFNKKKNLDDNDIDIDSETENNGLVDKIYITDDDDSFNSSYLEHNTSLKNKPKYKNLDDFMMKNKCQYKSKNFTHSWWDNTNNRLFLVNDNEYNIFLDLYISEFKTKYGKLHIMEKPLENGPLCLDFDIKISDKIRCLEMININSIIKIINNIIKKYFKLSEKTNELISYVLIKNKPYFDAKKKYIRTDFIFNIQI